ncbi:glycosyltransferase family 4 protein [Paenibacillus sp. Y412MC10]|uniref:glycosyltransferase family 4 protein n=1 Tax=Geobacillus sp. (strain Y412MC10) TaxID=481743 RepID=UPI00119CE905|nr:glycosyltransferase family 4 protein [Paenibacillus sp. Y412MC10]
MKRNIVFVINYFYPDYASTGQLLTELCLHIQHDFNITVIAAETEENAEPKKEKRRFTHDRLENIDIIRIKLPELNKRSKQSRLKYILTYFFYSILLILRLKRVHLIYTISTPPIVGGLIGTIGKYSKRAKHIYNIQDFNPEQAEAIGYMNNKLIFKLARWVDTVNCKCADHIITVGKDMQQTLVDRFKNSAVTDNTVINNWTDEKDIVPLPKDHPKVADFIETHGWKDKFIVMYSGNLGLYYDLENLIDITSAFKEQNDIVFVFIGDGAVKNEMQQKAKENPNVFFLPFQPKSDIKFTLNAADIHLVVNQKGIKGVSVPSKIYGVMAAGKPILGVLERGSEAAMLIENSRCGTVVEPQNYDEVIKQIYYFYNLRNHELTSRGLQGRTYLDNNLRRDISLDKYRNLLLSV